jgi:hypothetical protein
MKVNRKTVVAVVLAFILAFLFLVPVVSYGIPPGTFSCPANGCNFLRYGSVTYWGLGVGGTWRDVTGYSISVASASAAVSSSSSVSYTVSSACIGPTTTSTVLSGTSTVIQTCSVSQLILNAQGCYDYSSGATLCVRGASLDSVADLYGNGTIIVTYPSGYEVTCDLANGTGPCLGGIP